MNNIINNAAKPLVCICIPVYNGANTIIETINSILKQTYKNFIIKIVDNASTDDTVKIIKKFINYNIENNKDYNNKLILVEHDVNLSGEGNFNRCISYSEGKYCGIFHADDVYQDDIIEKQVALLESNKNISAVFTEANIIDNNSNQNGKIIIKKSKYLYNTYRNNFNFFNYSVYDFEHLFKAVLENYNFLICPSALVRTDIYKDYIKQWNSSKFKSSADLDLWLRISKMNDLSRIAVIHEKLINYRISSNQYSNIIRSRGEQADFFLVTDHYLNIKEVKNFITKKDLDNYNTLKIRDKVMRVVNYYLLDEIFLANKLLKEINIISWQYLKTLFLNKKKILILFTYVIIKIFLILKLFRLNISKTIILKAKKYFNK